MKDKKTAIERHGIPWVVKIGACDYKVTFCSPETLLDGTFGSHNRSSGDISIQEGLPRSTTWIVLFREILYITNITLKKTIAEPLASSLLAFIDENNFPQKKIPSSVKIGPCLFRVMLCEAADLPDQCGENYRETMEIKLRKNMSPSIIWEIFLHECLHAMNNGFCEETIEYLSSLLFITLDNMKLLRC